MVRSRQERTIERKRKEYWDCIPHYYDNRETEGTDNDRVTYRQVRFPALFHWLRLMSICPEQLLIFPYSTKKRSRTYADIQLTANGLSVWRDCSIFGPFVILVVVMSRVSMISVHPSSLCSWALTPVFSLFPVYSVADPYSVDVYSLSSKVLDEVEADTYWCLSRLLDGIHV